MKFILSFILSSYPAVMISQKICFNYKGYWSDWEHVYGDASRYDNGAGVVFSEGGLPFFSFQITSFVEPSREQLKEHRKTKEWLEYTGYVEYYVNDKSPTAGHIAKQCELVRPNPRRDITPTVKRRAYATIRIAPYKDYPEVYNLFFDDIGVGVSIEGVRFTGKNRKNTRRKRKRIVANVFQSVLLFPIGLGSWAWNPIN